MFLWKRVQQKLQLLAASDLRGHRETTSEHLSPSLFPRNLRGMFMIKASHPKGSRRNTALAAGSICRSQYHPSLSLPDCLHKVSPHPPPSLDVILYRWSQTHLFWLWDGKKNSSITFCHSALWYYHQYAVLGKHLPTVSKLTGALLCVF